MGNPELVVQDPQNTAENPQKKFQTKILKRRWLSTKTFELECARPADFDFQAGQNICILYQNVERYYSPVSAPSDKSLTLCIRHVEEGLLTPFLADADIGTPLTFTGPHGYFTFKPSQRKAVFVATGTGIAPFVSMGRSGVKEFILLHGIRIAKDLYYESFLRPLAARYVPCISGDVKTAPLPEGAFGGKVLGYIKTKLPPQPYDFYLCGRQDMIRDVTLIVDAHFPESRVFTEVFY